MIRIKGKKEELDKLQSMMIYQYAGQDADAEQRLFRSLVPIPDDIAEERLYRWVCDHWGTNREPLELWFDRIGKKMLELSFETAWATPKGIFKAITAQFPSVTLGGYYADENYGFNCGIIMGNANRIETVDLGDDSDAAIQFSEKVWDMIADETYIGKTLEDIIRSPLPTDFIEVGLSGDGEVETELSTGYPQAE